MSVHLIYRPQGVRALRTACGLRCRVVLCTTTDRDITTCANCRRVSEAWAAGGPDLLWKQEGYHWEREAYP